MTAGGAAALNGPPEGTDDATAPPARTPLQVAAQHTAPPHPAPTGRPDRPRSQAHAWAELLRLPALFTVPGDALAGAAAASASPTPRTLLALASSLCLYEAGMCLNDWADRDVDAVERPHRPLPSGRIHPAAALSAACALTGAGLTLAACAGRPALTVAMPLAATVWAYDLALKNTPAGPFAMASARTLDLLLGAAASGTGPVGRTVCAGDATAETRADELRRPSGTPIAAGAPHRHGQAPPSAAVLGIRRALPSAALLGAHTLAVTAVSRRETQGGSPLMPCAALAATVALARLVSRPRTPPADRIDRSRRRTAPGSLAHRAAAAMSRLPSPLSANGVQAPRLGHCLRYADPQAILRTALAATYAATAARPYFHATLNPSPPLTQRAVAGGIRAMIPLQAALAARSGTPGAHLTAVLTTALAPLARRFAKKVSVT
ncbi:SCO3242 family prenyltransferase [Streptomyces sp. NPDC005374]|uniref:SCO3242 family prenyltransferase n=1 Tax=Streptomyces sp. NPDC005374 TaxID=3364713 RepID=UPI0036964AE1